MSRLFRSSCALALGLVISACPPPTPPPPTITMNATPATLPGDGKSEATIDVSRPGSVDVTVRTGRGTFKESGKGSYVVTGGSGSVTYVVCDSVKQGGCSGPLTIHATSDDNAAGEVTLSIGQGEICNDGVDNDLNGKTDCADSTCLSQQCSPASADAGIRLCDASGQCVCASGNVEICTNGIDDNCDGKVDCADPTCDQSSCTVSPGVGGRCNMKVCSCMAGMEICSNGVDDDCDGLIDCGDPDCKATTTQLGKVCNVATGLTCSVPDSTGKSTCTVCPGGTAHETGALCSDGIDNDCDGLVDCLDPDCAMQDCKSAFSTSPAGNGWKCNPASTPSDKCECSGNGGASQATETTCDDGFDNDCDGKADCADTDCLAGGGQVCGTFGKKCLALNSCACGATVEDCKTPADDNCNGLINCQEISCRPAGTGYGAICDESGNACSQVIAGVSTCSTCTGNGGIVEVTEGSTGGAALTCGDGKDNDCDSTAANPSIDCQDSDCAGKPCSLNGGICNFALKRCTCPGGLSNEQGLCNDGIDNDCDGLIDCLDPDCQPIGVITPGSSCGAGNGRLCTSSGTCACSGNGGSPEAIEVSCGDGKDNDCDGVSDCADTDCRPVGNVLGKICDVKGNTCANVVAGVSACNVCSGNGGQAQTSEFSCGDGKDNDCDGLVDCQDPKCNALACSSTGSRCVAATRTCACPGPEALGETTCGDGLDNDCDGLIDCLDPDCQPRGGNPARACSTTGKFCTTSGTCACSGNGGTAELTEGAIGPSTCGDGIDNDCDGVIDCADSDCKAPTPGTFGKDCSHGALFATKCDVTGVCVCPGGQASEATCGDGLDNDCDGLIDCADPNCANQLCAGGNGRKCSGSPLACICPTGSSPETNCSNGIDDDCDGLSDCADPDCQGTPGKQCNVGNANYVCTGTGLSAVCADQTASFNVTVQSTPVVTPSSNTPNRVPADGLNTSLITATLKNTSGTVVPGATITFSVVGGGTVLPASVVTNGSGVATATYTAATTQGTAVVTATYSPVSGSTSIDLPRLGQIKFLTQQYSVMGVKSSSFQETNQLTFQLLDTNSQPYPPGLSVNFTHQQFGGSYIGSAPICSGIPVACTATAVTDNAGFVSVLLHSGNVASVVSVSAAATAGGASANATVSNLAIVGAKANSLHLSLDCTPKNVAAFSNNNCTNSFYPATITCRVAFADRFNNVLGVPTLATFSSEAGAAGTPSTTPAYSPGDPNLGIANGFVAVSGYSLPVDVTPRLGEGSRTFTDACGSKTHNPRDGLVTIIVSANGEEGFIDGSNSMPTNGQYDVGEYFMDQGEPFVDANDNGIRDNNEAYVDGNTNGVYDGPNGVWDGNTVVWAETRVMYTGYADPQASTFYSPLGAVLPINPATPNFSWSAAVTNAATYGLVFADSNFNYLTQAATYPLQVLTTPASSSLTAAFTSAPPSIDSLGLSFTQQYCTAAPAVCGNTCNSIPCYLTTKLSNYSYGMTTGVTVTYTAPTTTYPFSAEVRANATIGGVTLPVSVLGNIQ